MSELEEKLGAMLKDPQLMEQIQSMAQALGGGENTSPEEPGKMSIDPGMLQKIMGMASQGGRNQNQEALIHALYPYLSKGRIQKLERAMRAARMAGAANTFLNVGGLFQGGD